jgi:hypothetical protein
MNFFKSPLRRKIEHRIFELTMMRADNVRARNGITHRAEEYSKLLLEDCKLHDLIKELRELLK